MAAPGKVMFPENPSRQEYRAALRKARRKRRRQELARLRDSGLSREEEEDAFTEEQRLEEKLLESERQRLHEAWLLREQKAQEEFRRKKEREAAARTWQEERDRKLREEGEEQQRREREDEERKRQARGPRQEAVQRLLEPAGPGLRNGAPWRNPEPPPDPRTTTERDRADCPFYSKTGACRFGDRCSRRHRFPSSSPTLLIKSMFTTFGMEQCRRDDYDPDASLEHSEEETYQHFLDFYDDVLPEFRNAGRVVQFTVSCNLEPHLRGNVYVQYQSEEECRAALSLFNGRWYAGRRLQCELCPVTRWKAAICGLFERHQCPRGKRCNFLHVFRNPNNEFRQAGGGTCPPPDPAGSSSGKGPRRRGRAGRREDYHARPRRRRSPGPARSYPRRRGAERKRRSSPRGEESRRRPSGSRAGPRSPSRGRKRGRGGGRGRGRGRGGRSRSSSGSRSRGRRRSGSRDRTTQSPKGK